MESMGLVTDGMNKAKVDKIIGLFPSISISQGISNRNPRSTVGTFTEILTYIRVLYAKCGERQCPKCSNLILPVFNVENTIEENNQISSPHCDNKLDTLTMAHFSFNKQEGFCKTCSGLGEINDIVPSSIVNENLSVAEGAVSMWKAGTMANHYEAVLHALSRHYELEFNSKKAIKDFTELERLIFYYGVDSEEFIKMYPDIAKPKKVSDGYFEGIFTF